MKQDKSTNILGVGSIVFLGFAFRIIWLLWQGNNDFVLDEAEYVRIAEAIRSGRYVDDGRWLRSPLFPLLIAPFLSTGGDVTAARLVQVVLGTLLILLIYQVAWMAWRDVQSARIAMVLAACSFPLIVFSSYLMAETLLLVLFCGLILMLFACVERPTWWRAGGVGILLGLALLTKPIAIGTLPPTLITLWRSKTTLFQKGQLILTAGGLCLVVLLPWIARNWVVHQRFIPLDTTSGFNLWFGSRPPEQSRTLVEQWMRETYPNPADRSAAYIRLAIQNARTHPRYTLERLGYRLRQFWRLQADVLVSGHHGELYLACPRNQSVPRAITQGADFGHIAPACWWRWLNLSADVFDLLVLIGVTGVLMLGKRSLFLTIACPWIGILYLLTAFVLVQPRLRMPLIPVLIPLAAAGLRELFSTAKRLYHQTTRWRARVQRKNQQANQHQHQQANGYPGTAVYTVRGTSWVRLVGAGICLAGGVWATRLIPLVVSQGYDILATAAWRDGAAASALAYYRSAIQWYPSRLEALVRAGQVAEAIGAYDEALSWYHAATEVVPHTPHAHIGSARILSQQHDQEHTHAALRGSLLSFSDREAIAFAATILPPRSSLAMSKEPAYNHGYVLGFYPPDTINTSNGSESALPHQFRWTAERAAMRFGTQPTPETILSFRLAANRPARSPTPDGQVNVMDMEISYQFPLTFDTAWRIYRLLIPPTRRGIQFRIQVEPFRADTLTAGDTRDLGVVVDWAKTTCLPK